MSEFKVWDRKTEIVVARYAKGKLAELLTVADYDFSPLEYGRNEEDGLYIDNRQGGRMMETWLSLSPDMLSFVHDLKELWKHVN